MIGLTVPDTSENATANLAWTEIKLPKPVYAGDTLWAETEVLERARVALATRLSASSRPHAAASTSAARS